MEEDQKTAQAQAGGTQAAPQSTEETLAASGAEESAPQEQAKGKTFTQEELDGIIRKRLDRERKLWEKQASLTDDQRIREEYAQLKSEMQFREASTEMLALLQKAEARSPELLLAAARGEFEFDEAGKLANADALVADIKARFPDQFGKEKPRPGADGGAGKDAALPTIEQSTADNFKKTGRQDPFKL